LLGDRRAGENDAVAAAAASSSTSLHAGRRCRSTTHISDLAAANSRSHIDRLFCAPTTAVQQQPQQAEDDEENQRSL